MAERKIFGGARLKRLRARLGLSQIQMAGELGVSPSYLNLIERNQRPLTVQVLLKLSRVYGIDLAEVTGEESGGAVERLKEIFSDPLLVGELPGWSELSEMVDAAPNAARGLERLYLALREAQDRLSNLAPLVAGEAPGQPDAAAPVQARPSADYFEAAAPWFAELEAAAEAFAAALQPRDDPMQALKAALRDFFGVETRILPGHVMPAEQARYDRHSQRLFLSERVPLIERPFLLAYQAALLGHADLLDRLTGEAGLSEPEALRVCRIGFARRLGEAILAPAARLGEAARDLGLHVPLLSQRFVLRPSRLAARLAAIGAAGRGLPPAFAIHLDGSGAILWRVAGANAPMPRFGPLCSRLPLFDDLQPGQALRAEIALPDGSSFLVWAAAEAGHALADIAAPRRLLLIGWRRDDAGPLAAAWPALPPRPVGVTCRLCERLDCAHRLHPPASRPSGFQPHIVGPSELVPV